jgi:hypothetical protein
VTAPSVLDVWPGHRGDGEVAYTIAVAASFDDVAEAKQASHDVVVDMTGGLRAGPVRWVLLARSNALNVLDWLGMRYEPEAADFLIAHEHALVVVAMAKTDAPWRWTS